MFGLLAGLLGGAARGMAVKRPVAGALLGGLMSKRGGGAGGPSHQGEQDQPTQLDNMPEPFANATQEYGYPSQAGSPQRTPFRYMRS